MCARRRRWRRFMGLFDGTPLEQAVTCEHCGKTHALCDCPRGADGKVKLPREQAARVHREKRRGKWTTVVTGLDASATDLKGLLKELKGKLGAGGTTTEDGVEVQGDHKEKVIEVLKRKGYAVKGAGG